MLTLVVGGAASGKSAYAERLVLQTQLPAGYQFGYAAIQVLCHLFYDAIAFRVHGSVVQRVLCLREGMELPGIVGNITNFGAFVDIGIKENGLVHLSQLADRFISDPNEVVSIHQHIRPY